MRKYWIVLIRHGQGIGLQKEKGQTFLPALSCVCATALSGKNFFRFCQVLCLHDDAGRPQFLDIGQVNANDYGLEVRALALLVEPRL